MHILYYSWQENTTSDFLFSMQALGHQVSPCMHELSYYFSDGVESDILDQLQAQTYDAVFTFNFFPLVSDMAESLHIPYICWVFDCPHYTLYSNSIRNSCNYLFLFDRDMCQSAIRRGARHAFHLPLAVNTARLKEQLGISSEGGLLRPDTYIHDISFVGSLYESSHYSSFRYAPNHLRGYLAGIIAAQKEVWGIDLISPVLTPGRLAEFTAFMPYSEAEYEMLTAKEVFCSIIQKEVTSQERIEAVNRLAASHSVALYTGSDTACCPDVLSKGTVSYTAEMPDVFYRSKINLNLTLRSITSGIPLRALDILGCGGFLLSNYQPELCEYFTPDVDFVYFNDMDDLEQKVCYYLAHEEERCAIAAHGYRRACDLFSYHTQLSHMLTVFAAEPKDC